MGTLNQLSHPVLSSPSRGAAEDNVEERENSEVTQFLVTGYSYGRTDRETCQLKYYFRLGYVIESLS